jgi:hypothetical protein
MLLKLKILCSPLFQTIRSSLPMPLIIVMFTCQHPTPRSLSLPEKSWASIFVSLQWSFLDDDHFVYEVSNINHFSFCNTVINGLMQFPNIMKERLAASFSRITFKMQITDYLASANSPIHTSHFDPGSLRRVHLLRTFSVFQSNWALDWGEWSDSCCCLFHSFRL